MPMVYISYRRADSADITGRIYDHLAERYGRRNVVKDIDVALAGHLAAAQVAEALSQSDAALVVIGKHWLDASAGSRRRGIDDPHDPVRLELETALRLGVPIIPALVGGASMPSEKRLPESLRPLVHYNGLPVQPDPDFTRDMERVYAAIAYLREQPRHAPAPAAPAPAVAAREASSAASAHRSLPATLVAEPPRTALRRVTYRVGRPLMAALSGTLLLAAIAIALAHGALGGVGGVGGAQATETAGARATAQSQSFAAEVSATATAQAQLATKPYTPNGIGPCDSNPSERFDSSSNTFGWQWDTGTTCEADRSTARLVITQDNSSAAAQFYGLTSYVGSGSVGGFPAAYKATMTITFANASSSGGNQYYCAEVGIWAPQEDGPGQVPYVFGAVCRDGSWYALDWQYRRGGAPSQPLHFTLTVKGQTVSVSVNGQQLMPPTTYKGPAQELDISVAGARNDAIAVSGFSLTPLSA